MSRVKRAFNNNGEWQCSRASPPVWARQFFAHQQNCFAGKSLFMIWNREQALRI